MSKEIDWEELATTLGLFIKDGEQVSWAFASILPTKFDKRRIRGITILNP